MSKKIYINPGHGAGGDYGACYYGRREADDALKLCLLVRDRLKAAGVETRMSRETTDGNGPGVSAIAKDANGWGADLVFALHRNASTDPTAHGVEIYVYDASNAERKANAQTIVDRVVAASGMIARPSSVKQNRKWVMIKDVKAPSYYLEDGFISNEGDNAKFDAALDASAEAITRALCEIVGASTSDTPAAPSVPAAPAVPSYPEPTRLIANYTTGDDVKWVQEKLQGLGYSLGSYGIDGKYGDTCESSVKQLQRDYGLSVDGIVGTNTRKALKGQIAKAVNPYRKPTQNIYLGDWGDGIRWVQYELKRRGYNIGSTGIDGQYGASTKAAVERFQRASGLSVDGIVGPKTREALAS